MKKYTREVNVRYLFRYYSKVDKIYLTEKEARTIRANDLSEIKTVAIEQCTGFYDKWHVDVIYEGDIVKDEKGNIGIVFYDMKVGQYLFGEYWTLSGREIEIIGNCHDE